MTPYPPQPFLGGSAASAAAAEAEAEDDSRRMFYVEDLYHKAATAEGVSSPPAAPPVPPKAPAEPAGTAASPNMPTPQPDSGAGMGIPGMGGGGGPGKPPPPQCTPREAVTESLQEALIVLILYLIVAAGKFVHDREALETLRRGDFWVWVVLLVTVGTFLKYFSPKIRDSVLNAAVFNVILLMMQPIKRMTVM